MKKRIDVLLFERGLAKSREKAKALIIAGDVSAGGKPVKSPSETYEEDCDIFLKDNGCPYVSRGGLKLEKALDVFSIKLENKVCADIGASTGGFTDCMLKNGAKKVFAVDVGYGQIDWAIRNDDRVVVMERTNARYLEHLEERIDFASIDVSFISLSLIFPAVCRIGSGRIEVAALIKPQFEAGKGKVGKKGVVKDPSVHTDVIWNIRKYGETNGLGMIGLSFSPIKGPSGNIEYLSYFLSGADTAITDEIILKTVNTAHESLG